MNAIPFVSDTRAALAYYLPMAKQDWRGWGKRFREHAYDKGHTLESLAETLGRNASSLRHWTNGTRQINLSEFFELCDAAKIDAALILFGAPIVNDETIARLGDAFRGVLEPGPTAHNGGRSTSQRTRRRVRA